MSKRRTAQNSYVTWLPSNIHCCRPWLFGSSRNEILPASLPPSDDVLSPLAVVGTTAAAASAAAAAAGCCSAQQRPAGPASADLAAGQSVAGRPAQRPGAGPSTAAGHLPADRHPQTGDHLAHRAQRRYVSRDLTSFSCLWYAARLANPTGICSSSLLLRREVHILYKFLPFSSTRLL